MNPAMAPPWYRQPWPWLLMAGPAIVVVAGIVTAVIAFTGADGVIADDYYKQGMAINRTLAREAKAALVVPAALFDTAHRDRQGRVSGDQHGRVEHPVLLGATQFLTVEHQDEHGSTGARVLQPPRA